MSDVYAIVPEIIFKRPPFAIYLHLSRSPTRIPKSDLHHLANVHFPSNGIVAKKFDAHRRSLDRLPLAHIAPFKSGESPSTPTLSLCGMTHRPRRTEALIKRAARRPPSVLMLKEPLTKQR